MSRVGYAARTFSAATEHNKGTRSVPYKADAIAAPRKILADRLEAGLKSVSKDVLREVIKVLLAV